MGIWCLWAFLLICQDAASTFLARAVNGYSLSRHAIASVLCGSIWFGQQFLLIGFVVFEVSDWWEGLWAGIVYVTCTTVGSVLTHWAMMRGEGNAHARHTNSGSCRNGHGPASRI